MYGIQNLSLLFWMFFKHKMYFYLDPLVWIFWISFEPKIVGTLSTYSKALLGDFMWSNLTMSGKLALQYNKDG